MPRHERGLPSAGRCVIVRAAMKLPSFRTLCSALAFALAAVTLSSCTTVEPAPASASATARVLSGSVLHRERNALPESAKVRVQLIDGNPTEPAPKVFFETTFPTQGKQVPVAFALPFDTAKLEAGRPYALRAYILVDDKIAYITRSRIHIDPNAPPATVSILVTPGTADPVFADSPAPPGPARGGPSRSTLPRGSQGGQSK